MQGFDSGELLTKFRYPILILLIGTILIGGGIFFYKSGLNFGGTKVEVLGSTTENSSADVSGSASGSGELVVEISGEVINPGVYKLPNGSRVDDLLIVAGGFSANADRAWTDRYLNRAAKITDGQKVYIPPVSQQSTGSTARGGGGDQTVSPAISSDSNALININTASLSQLDALPGIGQVYGQSIIDHRPYSTVDELLSKGALKTSVYNKVKDMVTIY
jgi:competence protein ComEA